MHSVAMVILELKTSYSAACLVGLKEARLRASPISPLPSPLSPLPSPLSPLSSPLTPLPSPLPLFPSPPIPRFKVTLEHGPFQWTIQKFYREFLSLRRDLYPMRMRIRRGRRG